MDKTESLIFELSVRGRRATTFPPALQAESILKEIPSKYIRKEPPALPEVTEGDVVRHFTRISQLNFSADTHFYPLGSCTMKYNPRINEKCSALPGFTNLHPYQDISQIQGMLELFWNLERMLCELTGMSAFSLQPAAGAHGELLGLLVTRAYFEAKGEKRTKVLVPDSAHGTNPASAALCGYSVVNVPSNKRGRIDKSALLAQLGKDVALVMITCPNTLGLFEDEILEISKMVHDSGALLYMDGANFNALVAQVEPAALGFDMMHLNLHKTFSVPHGGGGPGAGPLGVRKDLEKFLPLPRVVKEENQFKLLTDSKDSLGQIRSFYGSTGALIRAYTYILSLGEDGLKAVSENAVLNANYIQSLLKGHYKSYINENCMHECVISGKDYGNHNVKTLDIAKRLLDYGFYAPTVYFPLIVPEAMMIEPTETESKKTLEEFVQAMKSIAKEAKENPEILKSAPLTTPVRRLDEVTAARFPILRWKK